MTFPHALIVDMPSRGGAYGIRVYPSARAMEAGIGALHRSGTPHYVPKRPVDRGTVARAGGSYMLCGSQGQPLRREWL
jgi:hypothetical protein